MVFFCEGNNQCRCFMLCWISISLHNNWRNRAEFLRTVHSWFGSIWLAIVSRHCPRLFLFIFPSNIYLPLQLTFMNGTRFVLHRGPVSFSYPMYHIHEERCSLGNVDDIMGNKPEVLLANCHCWTILFVSEYHGSEEQHNRLCLRSPGLDLISMG